MNEKDIVIELYRHFANYEYKLNNTFMFDWESDFFAKSRTGYFIECEIKVSRSDFFADFKKDKHKLFKDITAGKTHHITGGHVDTWDYDDKNVIGKVEIAQLVTDFGAFGRETGKIRRRHDVSMISHHYEEWKHLYKDDKWMYLVNDYGNVRLVKYTETIRAPFCRISIKPIEKINTPNQFYYVVPEGLVKLEEIPKYAGLIYIREEPNKVGMYRSVHVIKRAPYMHKRTMDLSKGLLQKYYNLWQYKVPWETKMQIRNDYSEKEE